MDAKLCDRCGRYFLINKSFKERPICRILAMSDDKVTLDGKTYQLDICPECGKQFERWLNNDSAVL